MSQGNEKELEKDRPKGRARVQKAFSNVLYLGFGAVIKGDDFTLFIERDKFIDAVNDALRDPKVGVPKPEDELPKLPEGCPETIDLSGKVCVQSRKNANGSKKKNEKACRVHAALCFGAKYYSVTVRKELEPCKKWKLKRSFGVNVKWKTLQRGLRFTSIDTGKLEPVKDKYASSLYALAQILFPAIFCKEDGPASGLVLITGGTGSGKTQVLNGLLGKYIWGLLHANPKRRPHIVTAGDPVETVFYADEKAGLSDGGVKQSSAGEKYFSLPIDFTARVLGTDVIDVEHALKDALRETPSAYVISELREDEDFRATLKFAATGQLVFATAHNTSLVDALRKLMLISGMGDHASARSILAQRLKAVIHLRQIALPSGVSITLPSVWLGNPAGIRNFVCDGLASLLPHGPHEPGTTKTRGNPDPAYLEGTVGLSWAVKELKDSEQLIDDEEVQTAVESMAQERDLAIH